MNDSRDDLSTADLAGQTPGRAQDDGYADPAAGSVGATRAPGDGAAYDEPNRTDTTDRPGIDRDLDTTDRDLDRTDRDLTGADRDLDGTDRGPDGPVATDRDLDGDDPDRRTVDGSYADTSGPAGAGVPPLTSSTTDTIASSTMDTGGTSTMDTRTPSTPDTAAPSTSDTGAPSTPDTSFNRSSTVDSTTGPLLGSSDSEGFRARWTDVQTGFVDAPREAVQKADALVAELMQHLARTFADERGRLEHQWDRGDDVPTDDLRDAFQRYRSFFERLLST